MQATKTQVTARIWKEPPGPVRLFATPKNLCQANETDAKEKLIRHASEMARKSVLLGK
jgi:hypothetical protein